MAAPLDGFRVIDASTGIAGPMAGMLLADFGADVVKVEPPGGEAGRADPGFAMWNRNKRGVVVDVESAADREWLEGRLAGADLCIFSGTTEHLASNGLDPAAVTGRYGGLVYLHTPPFGSTTPWAGGQESAALAHAALGVGVRQYGVADVPIDCVYPHVLYGQAIMAATSAVAALLERSASGRGQTVTVGALHGMVVTMSGMMTHEVGVETVKPAGGTGGPLPFYHLYECGDGQWLFQAGLKPAFYYAAFDELGVMDILSDERLGGEPAAMALPEQAPWVIERIQAAYRAKPRDEWLRILEEVGCPAGPVADRDVWLDHPQIEAIGMRAEVADPERGRVVMPGLPLNLMASPASVRRAAPSVGQDDGAVEAWEGQPVTGGALSGAAAPSGEALSNDAPLGDGPLAGRRILDLGSIIAGTYPGSLLAELGADVIKVESLDGDVVRSFGPTFVGYNKGKRSVSIDLRSEAGLAAFYALVKTVDVVIDNYRPGVLQKLKVHYDDLVQVNPSIIVS